MANRVGGLVSNGYLHNCGRVQQTVLALSTPEKGTSHHYVSLPSRVFPIVFGWRVATWTVGTTAASSRQETRGDGGRTVTRVSSKFHRDLAKWPFLGGEYKH